MPILFRNGDLLGPDLLLKFQRGDIDQGHLEAAWRKESKKVRKPDDWHGLSEMPLYCRGCSETAAEEVFKAAKEFPNHFQWINDMPLFCRGCTETAGEEVYKAAKEFPDHGLQHVWRRVIALGMERFCKACSKARNARAGAARL